MRLLIIEDDADGRELLAELFRMHDWVVTAVPTILAAMRELREGGFDVIISDEDLYGESGSQMLREASAEGLLSSVGTLMYTSEPETLEVPMGVRVLHKPLAIATLLDEAQAIASQALDHVPSSPLRRRRVPSPILDELADTPPSSRAR